MLHPYANNNHDLMQRSCYSTDFGGSHFTAFKSAGIEMITETCQTLLLVMQHDAGHCKTDAD